MLLRTLAMQDLRCPLQDWQDSVEIVGKWLCPFTVYLRVQDFGCRTGRVGALSFRSSHLGDKALRLRGSELPGQVPNLALPEHASLRNRNPVHPRPNKFETPGFNRQALPVQASQPCRQYQSSRLRFLSLRKLRVMRRALTLQNQATALSSKTNAEAEPGKLNPRS